MFLLDSLLLAPGKAVLFMFEELAKKAQEEFLDDDTVKQELQDIYARLEAGAISEKEFETRELGLMQRLEQIARAKFEGSWGTPGMGLQRAFLQGPFGEDQDVLVTEPVTEAVTEAEVLPAVPLEPLIAAAADYLRQGFSNPPELHAKAEVIEADVVRGLHPPQPALTAPQPALPPQPALQVPQPGLQLPQPPSPPPPVATAPPVSAAPAALTMGQVVESTMRHLSMLKLKASAVTAVSRTDDGWRVTAEVLERKSVPDTSDLLGVYDLQLDAAGNVLRYERTHLRRRSDLGR